MTWLYIDGTCKYHVPWTNMRTYSCLVCRKPLKPLRNASTFLEERSTCSLPRGSLCTTYLRDVVFPPRGFVCTPRVVRCVPRGWTCCRDGGNARPPRSLSRSCSAPCPNVIERFNLSWGCVSREPLTLAAEAVVLGTPRQL